MGPIWALWYSNYSIYGISFSFLLIFIVLFLFLSVVGKGSSPMRVVVRPPAQAIVIEGQGMPRTPRSSITSTGESPTRGRVYVKPPVGVVTKVVSRQSSPSSPLRTATPPIHTPLVRTRWESAHSVTVVPGCAATQSPPVLRALTPPVPTTIMNVFAGIG